METESIAVPTELKEPWTSIRVKVSTVQRFKRYGAKGDSYDDILSRVADVLECTTFSSGVKRKIKDLLLPRF